LLHLIAPHKNASWRLPGSGGAIDELEVFEPARGSVPPFYLIPAKQSIIDA